MIFPCVPTKWRAEKSARWPQLNVLSEQLSVTISALTVERNRLRQTLNGLAEGIMATDVHLQITHTNPALYQLLEVEAILTNGAVCRMPPS